jgi:signal transduction histidine kinase/ActR/RegA family two-component response regulator
MMATELAATKSLLRTSKVELAAQLRDLRRLHTLHARLSSHVELSSLLQEVLSAVCELQSAPMGLLLLRGADAEPPTVGARIGVNDAHAAHLLRVPPPHTASGVAIHERRAVIIEDLHHDDDFPDEQELGRVGGFRATCCVPLQARTGQIIGVIATCFAAPHRPSARELQLVELYGGQAVEFIENARHFQDLLRANRLKDEFLATLSHEIRTPLNAVLGWTRVLRTTGQMPAGELGTRALEAIERNSRIQAQLVEDLVDISRIVTGKLNLSFSTVNLSTVVMAALDTVRPAAQNKSLTLIEVVPGNVLVFGDAARLQQVAWNLLTNAVRFTPPAGTVTVRLERSASSAIMVVTDTGVGISSDFLPHVFDRFRQGMSLPEAQNGLGLGLAIVRHLTEAHGGHVEASSPGRDFGATFTVTLPIASADATVGETVLRPPSVTPPDLTGRRILIVDNEAESRDLLASALGTFGAQTTVVDSGVQALTALQRAAYDVLIADIGMADMNGYALIQTVRALTAKEQAYLPALALTVYADAKDRDHALAAGFDRHVAKPIAADHVAVIVSELMSQTGHAGTTG